MQTAARCSPMQPPHQRGDECPLPPPPITPTCVAATDFTCATGSHARWGQWAAETTRPLRQLHTPPGVAE